MTEILNSYKTNQGCITINNITISNGLLNGEFNIVYTDRLPMTTDKDKVVIPGVSINLYDITSSALIINTIDNNGKHSVIIDKSELVGAEVIDIMFVNGTLYLIMG